MFKKTNLLKEIGFITKLIRKHLSLEGLTIITTEILGGLTKTERWSTLSITSRMVNYILKALIWEEMVADFQSRTTKMVN